MLNQGVDLRELAGLVSGGDRRLPRLVVVPGLTDLAFDLYAASGDPLNGMTAFLAEDLVKIRAGVVATCGSEDRFNALIAEYIRAAADNYRNAVSSETAPAVLCIHFAPNTPDVAAVAHFLSSSMARVRSRTCS